MSPSGTLQPRCPEALSPSYSNGIECGYAEVMTLAQEVHRWPRQCLPITRWRCRRRFLRFVCTRVDGSRSVDVRIISDRQGGTLWQKTLQAWPMLGLARVAVID